MTLIILSLIVLVVVVDICVEMRKANAKVNLPAPIFSDGLLCYKEDIEILGTKVTVYIYYEEEPGDESSGVQPSVRVADIMLERSQSLDREIEYGIFQELKFQDKI